MTNAFVRKLEHGASLTDADRAQLLAVTRSTHVVPARRDVIAEGDVPTDVHLVLEGVACRYKMLSNGRRQIMAFFLPGDICDLHVQILGHMDHSIGTLTPCVMAELSPATIADLTANPRINRALWWATLTDEGTLREWLVNMGQRPADQQLAHLFLEILFRLRAVGLAPDDSFRMFCTQEELGEATGLTPVHVSRTVTALKEAGLIRVDGRHIGIPDVQNLTHFSDFNPNYLHLRDRRNGAPEHGERIRI